jgi:BMFP domain-containing protein YqiC
MSTFASAHNRTDAVNNLYDSACDLLFAVQQIRVAAARPGAAPAIAATIGCIDAGLEELVQAIRAMSRTAVREVLGGSGLAVDVIEREFDALADALTAAHSACDEMRERLAPLMAQLTFT